MNSDEFIDPPGDPDNADPTVSILAHYAEVPSNTVRSVWVVSGTSPVVTFSADALFAYTKP